MLFSFISQSWSHRHTQTEPVSPSLAETELLEPPSTVPQTASAVSQSSAEVLAQMCKDLRIEFGCSDSCKYEDTPEGDYIGRLLNTGQ